MEPNKQPSKMHLIGRMMVELGKILILLPILIMLVLFILAVITG